MNRIFKKVLASIMVAVMVMCAVPLGGIDFGSVFVSRAGAKDINSCSVGDIITYGSYPQSKVTDSSLISALETAGNKYMWVSYNYYSGTGNTTDGQMKPDEDMMWYKDIPYNGNKYRAVWIKKYRPYYTGYKNTDGTYQDDNGYYTGNIYYFKYEPLKWRVLDPSEGFVMCTTSIDAQAYNNYILYYDNNNGTSADDYYGNSAKTYYASDWANSSIRAWLNDNFYNTAFTGEEKSQIGTTYNENKSTYSSKYDSANTSDKIFLLSYWDVINPAYGFSSSYSTYDTARQLKSTDYAKCQGCWQSTSTSYLGNSWWRLRSPCYSRSVAFVNYDGSANNYFYNFVCNSYYGIVPAFKFNPKSTIPESEIKDVPDKEVGFYIDKYKGKVTVNFKNSWFEKSPYEYNHELARFCASYAMLGYGYDKETVKSYLSQAGFNDFYVCDIDPMKTGRDEVNFFLASRDIAVNGKVQKFVFMGTIGSYEKQWYSNFDPLGYENYYKARSLADGGKTHRGFADARDFAYKHLCNYINELTSLGTAKNNIKILLTGHSRGAATANLLAAKLIDEESSFGISRSNIFTYTFATPNVTKKNTTADKYKSIFNIVNPEDFVTKVMLNKWGFSRYGITYTLPSKTNTGKKDYNSNILPKVSKEFDNYTGKIFDPYKEGEKHTYKIISKMGNNVKTVEELYTNSFWYDLNGLIPRNKDPFTFFKNTLINYLVNKNKDEIIKVALEGGPFYLSIIAYFAWPDIDMDSAHLTIPGYLIDGLMDIEIGRKFEMAHQMQTYAAYMNTLSKSQLTKYKAGYENTVNCPVDIEVYDSTGALVGRIVDNVIDEDVANGENAIVMDVDGDSKSFWLPSNEEFTVKLIGNDEGTMDYTVATVDSDTGETERVNFFDVEITDGKTMTGEVISEDFAIEDYTLELENGETLEPTEKVNAEEAQPIEITVTTDGNGLATESMSVKSGDYVTLNATPDDGNEFVGWYADGKLVSTDMTYSFVAKKDVTFTAKFKETETEIKLGDVNADGEINSSDALLLLLHSVHNITLTPEQLTRADVNKNGKVNSYDALGILKYSVREINNFAYWQPSEGNSSAVFSLNLVSEDDTTAVVSVKLESGSFSNGTFKLSLGDNISYCTRAVKSEAFKEICYNSEDEGEIITVAPNPGTAMLAVASTADLDQTVEYFLLTLTKKASKNIDNTDISLTVDDIGAEVVNNLKQPSVINLGDVNADGEINSADALLVLQHTVKQITLTPEQILCADVTKDNLINSTDALKILQYTVGQIDKF